MLHLRVWKVGAGDRGVSRCGEVKERLTLATMTLVPIFPVDFPAGHLRDEYADIRQALSWLPPEEGSGQGLPESTLEAMTEEEAGELAKSLFSLYTSAAEAVYGGLHGRYSGGHNS